MPQTSNFLFSGPTASLDWRSITPFAIPPRVVRRQETTRFESMALTAGEPAAKTEDLIGVLLSSTLRAGNLGCKVLRPLWAEEAMHRAYSFIRLIDAQNSRGTARNERPDVAWWQVIAVRDLALRIKELETAEERAVLPSAAVLRDIVTGIGTIFGRPANIELAITTECVPLLGYQRRALVLAAVELVNNALLHAFRGHSGGRIKIGLARCGGTSACLSVADNGIGYTDWQPNLTCGVAAGLADLLEADLAYRRMAGWTIAEISFPV